MLVIAVPGVETTFSGIIRRLLRVLQTKPQIRGDATCRQTLSYISASACVFTRENTDVEERFQLKLGHTYISHV